MSIETEYWTGNGEPAYEVVMSHPDSGKTVESELAKLGLNDFGGVESAAGCAD
jgi:hypothetical protein